MIDILSFAITDFRDTFIKAMNQDAVSFKSQFILESLVKKDPGFTYNLAHDNNNKVTGIVWMTSYMRDNFERFGNYLSIDAMRSSVWNAKEFCSVISEVGKINAVCKGFIIIETYDEYIFILESLFNICPLRDKSNMYTIVSDEFITKSILDSMGMYETSIFFNCYHLIMNLE